MQPADTPAPPKDRRFFCTQCGRCCRFEEGYVFLSSQDVDRLADFLRIPSDEVIQTYCRWVRFGAVEHLSLREQRNHDCIFWKDGGCSVYSARPVQCQTYPFWNHILEHPDAWQEESRVCPGIGVGTRYTEDQVAAAVSARQQNTVMVRPAQGGRF